MAAVGETDACDQLCYLSLAWSTALPNFSRQVLPGFQLVRLMLVISFATWTRRSLELSVIDWLYLTAAGKPITFKVKLARYLQLVRHASWSETFARRHLIQVKDKDPPSDSMQLNRLHYIQSHWCNHSETPASRKLASYTFIDSMQLNRLHFIQVKAEAKTRMWCRFTYNTKNIGFTTLVQTLWADYLK